MGLAILIMSPHSPSFTSPRKSGIYRPEWSSEVRSALDADSSEASSPELAGVESDSSMGATTKAEVF